MKGTVTKNESTNVGLYEAKTHLSDLIERASRGEEIVISKSGKPKAKLVAIPEQPKKPREFGQNFLGITYVAPDAFDPITVDQLEEWGF